MYTTSKSPRIANQQLKVQELMVHKNQDTGLYVVSGSDVIVFIDEAVSRVKAVQMNDDSAAACILVPAASVSIVDSSAYTAGGDMKAIKLASVTLANNDSLVLKYELLD